jgi:hypothetical protein
VSLQERIAMARSKATILRWLGIAVYVAAFLMPACKSVGQKSELISFGTYSGWQCAKMSLMLVLVGEGFHFPFFLAILGGLVNPMVVVIVAASFRHGFGKVGLMARWGILAGLVSSWVFFAIMQFVPLIGHIFWVAGILMILAAQLSLESPEAPA